MMIRLVLLFGAMVTIGCGSSTPPLAFSGHPLDDKKTIEEKKSDIETKPDNNKKPTEPKCLTRKPVTVNVPMSKEQREQVAEAFREDKPRSIALTLRGVQVPEDWKFKTAIHVFVNNACATADTSTDESSFVFAFYLSPLDSESAQNFSFDLAPALSRLKKDKKWNPGNAIRITFVVVPPAGTELPATLKVPFEEIYLPDPPKP